MVEYGNGVGQVAGRAGGGSGGPVDVGASVGQFVTDTVQTVSTLPPGLLLAGVAIVLLGLLLLRRAF